MAYRGTSLIRNSDLKAGAHLLHDLSLFELCIREEEDVVLPDRRLRTARHGAVRGGGESRRRKTPGTARHGAARLPGRAQHAVLPLDRVLPLDLRAEKIAWTARQPHGKAAPRRRRRGAARSPPARDFFVDNLLVRIHFIIVMIRWTGLAPWELEFPFPGRLISTFIGCPIAACSRPVR